MPLILHGYFGAGNAGDEMIHAVLRRRLPELPWRVAGLPGGPSRRNPLLAAGATLVYGGGELFQARTSARSLLYYAAVPRFARRFFAYGMGLDPALPPWALRLAARTLDRAARVWFRDEASAALYRAAGGRAPHGVAPDPVWTWEAPPLPAAGRDILWVPRDPLAPEEARRLGGDVVFLHPARDRRSFPGVAALAWEDPEALPALFAAHAAVVTMRYHGLVLAALAGRPAVAWAAHGKVAELAKELGAPAISRREEAPAALDAARRGHAAFASRAARLRADAARGLEELRSALA